MQRRQLLLKIEEQKKLLDITKVDKTDTKREREILLNKFTELN